MSAPWTTLAALLLLASCSSPPRPPGVDESDKRPANSAQAIELQACKHELVNTRILAEESRRLGVSAAATLAHVGRQQALAASQPSGVPANTVFTIRFGFASTQVDASDTRMSVLVAEAKTAPLVVLRGRTDSLADNPADARIARQRAMAVRDVLIAAGVATDRIRVTWQPAGDFVTEDRTPDGRSRNRRVEIEVYRQLPVAAPEVGDPKA
jgi:outer membrane protein OmpA-like peptidoglycan-associated protein